LGPPNSDRQAAATALSRFQLAKARSQDGMPWVGTKALETNDSAAGALRPAAVAAGLAIPPVISLSAAGTAGHRR
jgi:hypothetical protein